MRTHAASFEYVLGYSEVELRYFDKATTEETFSFVLMAYAKHDLKKQKGLKAINKNEYSKKNENLGYWEKPNPEGMRQLKYIEGSIDALKDVVYCVKKVRIHF